MSVSEYHARKISSRIKDLELGYRIDEIENLLSSNNKKNPNSNFWIGLNPDALQTPYEEIFEILTQINPASGSTIVDIGSAYGRMGYIVGECFKNVKFFGVEAILERHEEATRVLVERGYKNITLIHADVMAPNFKLPSAEYFFIYDFGERKCIESILEQISEEAAHRGVVVIGRGRLVRDLIERENPWLSQVITPRHFQNYSIYKTREKLTPTCLEL